jgi:hypothetical protein
VVLAYSGGDAKGSPPDAVSSEPPRDDLLPEARATPGSFDVQLPDDWFVRDGFVPLSLSDEISFVGWVGDRGLRACVLAGGGAHLPSGR